MREFIFTPSYYEWHLKDKNNDTVLHVMSDPSDATVHDDGTSLTIEELIDFCISDLDLADDVYSMNEEYNGLLLSPVNRLDSVELKTASEIMAKNLYDYYIEN